MEKRNGQAGIQEIIEGIKKDLKGKDEYWKEAQKLLPRGQKNKAITSIDEVEKDLYLARMFEHLPTRNHLSRYRVPQIPTTAVMGPTTK